MNPSNTTVVICCAGMGTRLGIGTTKALVNICGKPLIIHQLEQLKDYDDIRVVVGFQAQNVIDVVKEYRSDVMFAFNYDYESTGPAASMGRGIIRARKYVVIIDGDLLVNPNDFKLFLDYPEECLPNSTITSDEPVYLKVKNEMAIGFSEKFGDFEWPGLVKIKTDRLKIGNEYVYELLKPLLPLKTISIRTREIDTPDDYENAVKWVEDGYLD